MTDNEPKHPPTLIEPDSDDEGPPHRKRQRIHEGSTTDHGLAVLQAVLLLVVAAAELKTADQNLIFYDVPPPSSHQISSYLRDDDKTPVHTTGTNPPSSVSSFAASLQQGVKPDPSSEPTSCTTSPESHDSIMSRQLRELSPTDRNREILANPMALGATTNFVTTKGSALPSGRPLLAPPRLPHLKCGECFAKPSSRNLPSIKTKAVSSGSGKA